MNRLTWIFAGILFTFICAWLGLVIAPLNQMGSLQMVEDADGQLVPPPVSGLADQGRRVYQANGCVYCHSQQIRPFDVSEDHNRGWGTRRTVARDYIHEKVTLLGTMRTGPDLTNIGKRWGKDDAARARHYLHLYAPRSEIKGSIMPSFSFLFEEREIKGEKSPDALNFTGHEEWAPKGDNIEVVPTADARALVSYLMSLDRSYALKEAPEPK
jgi:cytochrome c oxidase cbb3-type subunit 2